MALVVRGLKLGILTRGLATTKLFRRWSYFLCVLRRGFLLGSGLCFYPIISTVKAGAIVVHVPRKRIIHVCVVDHGFVHVRHSGVVLEIVAMPSSAPVTVS